MIRHMFIRSGELVIIFKRKSLLNFIKSLQFYLLLGFFLIGTLPALAFRGTLAEEFKRSQLQSKVNEIQNQGRILSNQLLNRGYLDDPTNGVTSNSIYYISNIYDGRIQVIDKNFRIVSDTYGLEESKINISPYVMETFLGNLNDRYQIQNGYVEFTFPLYLEAKGEKNIEGVVLFSVSTSRMDSFVEGVFDRTYLLELLGIILIAVIAFLLSKYLTKPFKKLIFCLNHIADDNLDEEVEVDTFSETKEISDAVSMALQRLKILDESRQEFVSNVSHELKTPITSIRVLADSLLMQEDVPVELYREFMTDISEEIDRESKIIDDLLALVKMDKTDAELTVAPIVMNEMLKLILKRLRPLAKRRNIELVMESVRPVTAEVDEVKITLALSNLIENAIKYNVTDGWVKVTLDADHKFCYVKVADSGIGISEEFQSQIFERFYRVDKARSREKGGTGLGLAIAKKVINLHHGAIKVSSKENEGTVFTVRIPLTYIA